MTPDPAFRDGAYGTMLAGALRDNETSDALNARDPEAVRRIHAAYLHAGASILQTNTFMAHAAGATMQQGERFLAGVACAHAAFGQQPGRVAGCLGPAGTDAADYRTGMDVFGAAADEIIVETLTDPAQATAALAAWLGIVADDGPPPLVLSLSVSPSRARESWQWMLDIDPPEGVALGLNCCEGVDGLAEPARELAASVGTVHLQPSAGLPGNYLKPNEWAEATHELVEATSSEGAVASVGGCCGTTPLHIAALVRRFATVGS